MKKPIVFFDLNEQISHRHLFIFLLIEFKKNESFFDNKFL
jgi:hypothetical protein